MASGCFLHPRCPKDPVLCAIVLCLMSTAFQVAAVADSSWALSDDDLIGLFNECKSDPCDTGREYLEFKRYAFLLTVVSLIYKSDVKI